MSETFAPFGRLIPCQLVVTVDSFSLNPPIVGVVTEGIWHDGRLIVPAGTEIQSTAQTDRMRERIASQGQWALVWQSGENFVFPASRWTARKTLPEGAISNDSGGLRGDFSKATTAPR